MYVLEEVKKGTVVQNAMDIQNQIIYSFVLDLISWVSDLIAHLRLRSYVRTRPSPMNTKIGEGFIWHTFVQLL